MTKQKSSKSNKSREQVADNWLDIDPKGFAAENKGRPKPHLVKELVQNALDAIGQDEGEVIVVVEARSSKKVRVLVRDSGCGIPPENLQNIRTVFWTSKHDSHTKRGRMGRGFKEMLCLAEKAEVVSGDHALIFEEGGVFRESRENHYNGTIVEMILPWPRESIEEINSYLRSLLVPKNITLTLSGEPIKHRRLKHSIEASLPTEVFDDGAWTKVNRPTAIHLVPTYRDEDPMIYEMGIPVCPAEWEYGYHIDVQQRIPMNPKRDAVASGYQVKLHKAAIPVILPELNKEQILSDTISNVIPDLPQEIQKAIIDKGLGTNIVRQVPTVANGRRDFNADARENGFSTVDTRTLAGGFREVIKELVPTAAEVVTQREEEHFTAAAAASFSIEEWKDTQDDEKKKREELIKARGGQAHVAEVTKFAKWFVHQILSESGLGDFRGVALADFGTLIGAPDATWSYGHTLTIGLRTSYVFEHTLGAESLSLLIHEAAHHRAFHHGDNFHKEVERLGGVAANVALRDADYIRKTFPNLKP